MSKIPSGLKCEITVEQAYPHGVPEIPEEWEFSKFGFDLFVDSEEAVLEPDGCLSGVMIPRQACIVVRRKPTPPPKPTTCARSIVHGHCPCKDRCCYCHYEVGKPGKNLQWVVEFPYDEPAGPTPEGLVQQATFRVIRQVKPITQEELERARSMTMNRYTGGPFNMLWIKLMLRELGIAVEDLEPGIRIED